MGSGAYETATVPRWRYCTPMFQKLKCAGAFQGPVPAHMTAVLMQTSPTDEQYIGSAKSRDAER